MMDPAAVGVFVVFGAIAAVAAILFFNDRSKKRKASLQRLAGRIGGKLIDPGFLGEVSIEFQIERRKAVLEFWGGSKNSAPYSSVVIDVRRSSPGKLHILKDGFGQTFLKLFRAQDLVIGDRLFDADYVVKATPPSLASRVFSPERRLQVIRTVRRIQNYDDPTIDLDDQQLTIKVRQYFRDEVDLITLIETAREFALYILQSPPPPGVVLEEVKVSAEGECPVCGTAMREDVIRCEACRTPHHSECWQYMGRCSTYACNGKRFVA